jgi:hypothetical protein
MIALNSYRNLRTMIVSCVWWVMANFLIGFLGVIENIMVLNFCQIMFPSYNLRKRNQQVGVEVICWSCNWPPYDKWPVQNKYLNKPKMWCNSRNGYQMEK